VSGRDAGFALPAGWRAERGADGLELVAPDGARLRADFGGGALGWRLARARGREQAVARAAGFGRGRPPPRVFDATAGLGRDAAVLAALGCAVTAVERHPAIAALLEDALARAASAPAAEFLGGRLRLLRGDARELLRAGAAADHDAVLLDPMHPERRKSALVKREMRLFRALVGADGDAADLLDAALESGVARVAVKRPVSAPPLGGPEPSARIAGRTIRFDLYLRTMRDSPRANR
jgi:16S rRNA (guanine1516-N2)-methyltransferase